MVHMVAPPTKLQTPADPLVLSLIPAMGTLHSVKWLAVSIPLCICQALAEPLGRQQYQTPVSMHFLESTIESGFGNRIWYGPPGQEVSRWHFLQSLSTLCLCISSHGYFVPPSKKDQHIHTLVCLLELLVVSELYLGYSELLG